MRALAIAPFGPRPQTAQLYSARVLLITEIWQVITFAETRVQRAAQFFSVYASAGYCHILLSAGDLGLCNETQAVLKAARATDHSISCAVYRFAAASRWHLARLCTVCTEVSLPRNSWRMQTQNPHCHVFQPLRSLLPICACNEVKCFVGSGPPCMASTCCHRTKEAAHEHAGYRACPTCSSPCPCTAPASLPVQAVS